jgi:hypothetical protein
VVVLRRCTTRDRHHVVEAGPGDRRAIRRGDPRIAQRLARAAAIRGIAAGA